MNLFANMFDKNSHEPTRKYVRDHTHEYPNSNIYVREWSSSAPLSYQV